MKLADARVLYVAIVEVKKLQVEGKEPSLGFLFDRQLIPLE